MADPFREPAAEVRIVKRKHRLIAPHAVEDLNYWDNYRKKERARLAESLSGVADPNERHHIKMEFIKEAIGDFPTTERLNELAARERLEADARHKKEAGYLDKSSDVLVTVHMDTATKEMTLWQKLTHLLRTGRWKRNVDSGVQSVPLELGTEKTE